MILARESYPAVKWLVEMGVRYEVHHKTSFEKDGKKVL